MRSGSVIMNTNQVKMVQEITGSPRNCIISHLIEIKFKLKFQLLVSLFNGRCYASNVTRE